jgi:hypothetical protein
MNKTTAPTTTDIRPIWQQAKQDFCALLGEPQGLIFLGALLCYPHHATFRENGLYPTGIWLHGPKATGKTYLAQCAVNFFGYKPYPEIAGSFGITKSAAIRILTEAIGRPAIMDLYYGADRHTKETIEIIMNAFNGTRVYVAASDGSPKSYYPRTPIICAQGRSMDAALKSRFIHFQPNLGKTFNPGVTPSIRNLEKLHLINAFLNENGWLDKALSMDLVPRFQDREHQGFSIAFQAYITAETMINESTEAEKLMIRKTYPAKWMTQFGLLGKNRRKTKKSSADL